METLKYLIEERVISKTLGVSINDIFSVRRFKNFISARHIVWYFLHMERDIKLHDIAYRYSRDHSSVFHGIQSVLHQIEAYPEYKYGINEIKRLIA